MAGSFGKSKKKMVQLLFKVNKKLILNSICNLNCIIMAYTKIVIKVVYLFSIKYLFFQHPNLISNHKYCLPDG